MKEYTFFEQVAPLGLYEGAVIEIEGVLYNPFVVTAEGFFRL